LRNKGSKKEVNTNEWMNTYADTITLLLCFFVLLYSFSTINEAKWRKIVESFNLEKYDSDVSNHTMTEIPDITDIGFPDTTTTQATGAGGNITSPNDELYIRIKEYIQKNDLSSKVELISDENTISLRFKDTILFDPDSTVLRQDGKVILKSIGQMLKDSIGLIKMIEIQGHTAKNPDGLPQFKNTFQFSTFRAVNVLQFLLDDIGINPQKLSAVGYGQYHPIGDNETEEGRIKNRRVEIVATSITKETDISSSSTTNP
jgi:chemotaxis protein MotB